MKKRTPGIRTIPTRDGYTIIVTDREGQDPSHVQFANDGDVRVNGIKFDRREFSAIVAAVRAGRPKKGARS